MTCQTKRCPVCPGGFSGGAAGTLDSLRSAFGNVRAAKRKRAWPGWAQDWRSHREDRFVLQGVSATRASVCEDFLRSSGVPSHSVQFRARPAPTKAHTLGYLRTRGGLFTILPEYKALKSLIVNVICRIKVSPIPQKNVSVGGRNCAFAWCSSVPLLSL